MTQVATTWIELNNSRLSVHSFNTVIVGSGAAGLNAADRLFHFGQENIALVTENMKWGTSRNTGSDKQTYYKPSMCGSEADSAADMAKALFDGGSMDGDIALVEAALSARCFYRLVELGVPFPFNRYGEYVGYKTDHDTSLRATSTGPLTSKAMTERLEDQLKRDGIPVFDHCKAIGILVDEKQNRACGLVCLNTDRLADPQNRYVLFNCTNIVYATGGPAGMYQMSVYPHSQTGATGIALEAGVKGKNLTESQYGIASVKFRWNLSGTYQQVLPRYISTDEDGGDEREFLSDYFKEPGRMLDAIFLKGYQWPFDPRKVAGGGSSVIDLLVYRETVLKNRRVFLDYTRNPGCGGADGRLDFSLLGEEAHRYLSRSDALFGRPIDRLKRMNEPGVDLYKQHDTDLEKDCVEIGVCAQHNNGGLCGNIWWESNIGHFFPVGEVNGTHGVYRPGGSALNSGQVGSTRAAQYISARYCEAPAPTERFLKICKTQIERKVALGEAFLKNADGTGNIDKIRSDIGKRMTRCGAHIRSASSAEQSVLETARILVDIESVLRPKSCRDLPKAFDCYDLLITQFVYLSAIKDYIENGGESRGSYIVGSPDGEIRIKEMGDDFRFSLDRGVLQNKIQITSLEKGICSFEWRNAVPIPKAEDWFETVWNAYRKDEIIR